MEGRLTTAQRVANRQVNLDSVGYNASINAVDRPVTGMAYGLAGMKSHAMGPKRQIYDRSFWLGELKKKNGELRGEITKMQNEVEDINKDNQTYLTLERKYESLIKEVRTFEGELADYNLALDKYRSDTKPEDIEALFYHIKNQNDKQRSMLDKLFGEKKDMESEIQRYEADIAEINYANEVKLNDLDPEQRNEYERLKGENLALQNEINANRNELENVNNKLGQAEARLRADALKQRAQHLKEERVALLKKKEEIEL